MENKPHANVPLGDVEPVLLAWLQCNSPLETISGFQAAGLANSPLTEAAVHVWEYVTVPGKAWTREHWGRDT